jgi:hypothetical protein
MNLYLGELFYLFTDLFIQMVFLNLAQAFEIWWITCQEPLQLL